MTPLVSVLIKRNVRVKGKFDCKNYQAGKDLLRKLQCSRFYPAPFIILSSSLTAYLEKIYFAREKEFEKNYPAKYSYLRYDTSSARQGKTRCYLIFVLIWSGVFPPTGASILMFPTPSWNCQC